MAEMKVIAVGNSVGVILPRELAIKLGVQKGDSLSCDGYPRRRSAFRAQRRCSRRRWKSPGD